MALITLGMMAANGSVNANPLDLAVAQEYITTDQFTQLLPVRTVPGIHNIYRRETTRPNTAVYHVGGTISEGRAKFEKITDEVGRILTQVALDVKVDMSSDLTSAIRDQLLAARWEHQEKWGHYLINGAGQTSPSSDDGEIKGIKTLADALPSSQKHMPSTTPGGSTISTKHLDLLKDKVKYPVDFYLMPTRLLADYRDLLVNLGGVGMGEVMRTFTRFEGGQLVIENRGVPAHNGIPIYVSDFITAESTGGASGKYRVYAGSFSTGVGLEAFFNPANGPMGFTVEGPYPKETQDQYYMRVRHMMGISLRSKLALAYWSNIVPID